METFSALLAFCEGNSPVPDEFPSQRPVTGSFDVFFDLWLIKRLSKQSWGWWFKTRSRPLWRHNNETSPRSGVGHICMEHQVGHQCACRWLSTKRCFAISKNNADDKVACVSRANFRFGPSQWETPLLCNDVSHWLGANLESALVSVKGSVATNNLWRFTFDQTTSFNMADGISLNLVWIQGTIIFKSYD